MISPAVEPCFCGRLGNARGATDSCTKMLLAWGVSLPPFSRPGISCELPLWANGGSGSIPKMLRRPKPPSPRGPPKQHKGPAGHTQEAALSPAGSPPAPIFADETKKIPCGPSNTFSVLRCYWLFLPFWPKKCPFPILTLALDASASARLK